MKEKRHAKILEIIHREEVGTQEEMCDLLNKAGYHVTQATVSRDIRELKLSKVALSGGRQKYVLLADVQDAMDAKYIRVFQEGVVSIDMAQNILVIKTVSGMAMAVAAAIDAISWPEVLGCIAGDDTIFCAVHSAKEGEAVLQKLLKMVG